MPEAIALNNSALADLPIDAPKYDRGALSDDITWTFRAIPDRPPTITLVKEPEAQVRGGLHLVYKLEDDYGVVAARAGFMPKQTHRTNEGRPDST